MLLNFIYFNFFLTASLTCIFFLFAKFQLEFFTLDAKIIIENCNKQQTAMTNKDHFVFCHKIAN